MIKESSIQICTFHVWSLLDTFFSARCRQSKTRGVTTCASPNIAEAGVGWFRMESLGLDLFHNDYSFPGQ